MTLEQHQRTKKEVLSDTNLIIRARNVDEEYYYLWQMLKEIPFFREHGFECEIPEHLKFQQLAMQSPDFSGVDREGLYEIFRDEIYQPQFFEAGIKRLNLHRATITSVFPRLRELNTMWGFRYFPSYEIVLTAYGPGGSYNHEKGRITMLTRRDGTFRRQNPELDVIHEIFHIGIEAEIALRFRLSHGEKERLVEQLCFIEFGALFRNHPEQMAGDRRIDSYVTAETTINLPQAMERYVKDFPR